MGENWSKLSLIVLIVDSGFGGKSPKLSLIVLIVDSGYLEKSPKISDTVLIAEWAKTGRNYH